MNGFLKEYEHDMNGRQLDLVVEHRLYYPINCGDSIEIKIGADWYPVQIEMYDGSYYAIRKSGETIQQLDGKLARIVR